MTHNPNLLVLEQLADWIILMGRDGPYSAAPAKCGTFAELRDEIVALLEGGASAFRERSERYDLDRDAVEKVEQGKAW